MGDLPPLPAIDPKMQIDDGLIRIIPGYSRGFVEAYAIRYAEEAVRQEREACAKACEARIERLAEMKAAKFADGAAYYDHRTLNGDIGCLTDMAAAIRARSEQGREG